METEQQTTILLAEQDILLRDQLAEALRCEGYNVLSACDGEQALQHATANVAVAILSDNLEKRSSIECLRDLKEHSSETEVIILSRLTNVDDVVRAMRAGAFWCLPKPIAPHDLSAIVAIATELSQLKRQNRELLQAIAGPAQHPNLISKSPAMAELHRKALKAAALDSTILLLGASGTGKTTLAHFIHRHGSRSSEPFISVSCAAIPRELLESELFGHEKGAFTGATTARPGSIELAEGGTLFLDEIGELPLELQPKLLTFLQDGQVKRLGGNQSRRIELRVIAATNRDLEQMCREGTFREDLYYRINVLSLKLPGLAERKEDIDGLIKTTLERIAVSRQEEVMQLDPAAREVLIHYSWPGNVRELQNVLERATAFCEEQCVRVKDLRFSSLSPTQFKNNQSPNDLAGITLQQLEQKAIMDTLQACEGNKAKAAQMLGISTKSIYNKLKRMG